MRTEWSGRAPEIGSRFVIPRAGRLRCGQFGVFPGLAIARSIATAHVAPARPSGSVREPGDAASSLPGYVLAAAPGRPGASFLRQGPGANGGASGPGGSGGMGGTGGGGAGLFNNGQLPVADTTITGNVTGNGGTGGSGARPGGGGADGGIFQVDGAATVQESTVAA